MQTALVEDRHWKEIGKHIHLSFVTKLNTHFISRILDPALRVESNLRHQKGLREERWALGISFP